MLVGGGIYQLAPTIEDIDLETIVVNLVQEGFRQAEVVVEAIAVRRECIGHQNFPVAMRKGVLGHRTALARGGRHRIYTRFVNRDERPRLASAPGIVVQGGDHLQSGAAFVTEIASAAHDGDGSVNIAQMQRVHLLATMLVEVAVGVGARLVVGLPVPGVASTNNLRVGDVLRYMDGETQGVHLLATVVVDMRKGVGAALEIGGIMPLKPLARLLNKHFVGRMVHGEMQRVHLLATVVVGMRKGVGAALGVGGAVPNVAVANRLRFRSGNRMIDGQMEGDDRVAAMRGGERVGVVARFGVDDTRPAVGLASADSEGGGGIVVDGEVQAHDRIAAVSIREGGRIDARLRVG